MTSRRDYERMLKKLILRIENERDPEMKRELEEEYERIVDEYLEVSSSEDVDG